MNFLNRILPASRYLLLANCLIFGLQYLLEKTMNIHLIEEYGLYYVGVDNFKAYQLVTHFFLHANFAHILFNMMFLYTSSSLLERYLGFRNFLFFYFFCGIAGGVFHEICTMGLVYSRIHEIQITMGNLNQIPDHWLAVGIGASGALYGVFAGIAILYPDAEFLIFFIPKPIKAKYLLWGMLAFDFVLGVLQLPQDSLGHYVHLGGALAGILLMKTMFKPNHPNRNSV